MMKITWTACAGGKSGNASIPEGSTAEDLLECCREEVGTRPLEVKINNRYHGLYARLHDGDQVEFRGLESRSATRVYEDSLGILFSTAARHVLGRDDVLIENSLDQGIYLEIEGTAPVPPAACEEIEQDMRRMIAADVPFLPKKFPIGEAKKILEKQGAPAHLIPLLDQQDLKEVRLLFVEDVWHYAYGIVVPSAGYIDLFELKTYHRGLLLRYPSCHDPEHLPPYRDQPNLYLAFEEQERWESVTGVNYVSDLNRKIESGDCKDLILLSEALHDKKIVEIANEIRDERKRIILIAGPSSSGKTTFAKRLCIQMGVEGLSPLYLSTDDYFVNYEDMVRGENGEVDFEDLSAVDLKLFNANMNDLLAGREVDIPTFNFLTRKKEFGKRITKIDDSQPIVIEGIHGLNRKLTSEIPEEEKYRIYISPLTQLNLDEHNRIPTTDERMLRRMVRDYRFRGHDASSTLELWKNVRDGEDRNIFPYSGEADVIYNSYHIYEIAVLKKYAEPLLRAVPETDPEHAEAQRILKALSYFRSIDDESIIMNDSILREFIGGSVFVE